MIFFIKPSVIGSNETDSRVTRTFISWRVVNEKKYFGKYGQDVTEMVTRWTIYFLEEDKKARLIDTNYVPPVSLLPLGGDKPQSVPRSDVFPSGKYRLHLSISYNGVALKSFSEELTLTDEFRDGEVS